MKSTKYSKGLRIIPNNRSKRGGCIVTGYLNQRDNHGKQLRIRKTFSGVNAELRAQDFINQKILEDMNAVSEITLRNSKLDDEFEFGILGLIRKLRSDLQDAETPSIDLLSNAVEYFLSSKTRGAKQISVNEARIKYESRDKFDDTSPSHQKSWKSVLDKFSHTFGERDLSTISVEEIKDWIDRNDRSQELKRKDKAHLHALFSWARKQTYLKVNVVSAYEIPRFKRKEPVSLSIEQVHNLLFFATQVNKQSLVPYFALAIFAGLRPFEIKRARWEDIDWDEGIIRARQRKGGGFTRSVELPEICIEWLTHVKGYEKKGQITPDNYTKNFNVVRGAAGFKVSKGSIKSCNWWGLEKHLKDCDKADRPEWVNDICRHTAITYRLKIVKHIGEVAEWAGNSPDIINRNYRSVKNVTKKSTDAFYELTPEKVIKKGLI